jgi:hypothetical protein
VYGIEPERYPHVRRGARGASYDARKNVTQVTLLEGNYIVPSKKTAEKKVKGPPVITHGAGKAPTHISALAEIRKEERKRGYNPLGPYPRCDAPKMDTKRRPDEPLSKYRDRMRCLFD